jgi:hypothetical protein
MNPIRETASRVRITSLAFTLYDSISYINNVHKKIEQEEEKTEKERERVKIVDGRERTERTERRERERERERARKREREKEREEHLSLSSLRCKPPAMFLLKRLLRLPLFSEAIRQQKSHLAAF